MMIYWIIVCCIMALCACSSEENNHRETTELDSNGMILLELYQRHRDTDMAKAVGFGERLLSVSDSSCNNENLNLLAHIAVETADWWEKEEYSFTKSVRWRLYAIRAYECIGDASKIAAERYNLARTYYQMGIYHRSLAETVKAAEYFERHDKRSFMDSRSLLGKLYIQCGLFEDAYKCFSQTLEYAEVLQEPVLHALALTNMAIWQFEGIKDSAAALNSLERAAEMISGVQGKEKEKFTCFYNLSLAYMYSGDLSGAAFAVDEAGKYAGDAYREGSMHILNGMLSFMTDDMERSRDEFKMASEYFSNGEFYSDLYSCFNALSAVNESLGKEHDAYEALKRSVDIKVGIDSRNNPAELLRLQENLIREEEYNEYNRKKMTVVMLLAIVSVAFTVFFFLILLWYKRKKWSIRHKEAELRIKNDKVEIRRLQEFSQSKLLQTTIERLERLRVKVQRVWAKDEIASICADLRNAGSGNSMFDNADRFIPEFGNPKFVALFKKYPNLSVGERRLCVLINNNLSSKEISAITRQSEQTVNIARARLRKKFGLTGGKQSLQEFLQNFS